MMVARSSTGFMEVLLLTDCTGKSGPMNSVLQESDGILILVISKMILLFIIKGNRKIIFSYRPAEMAGGREHQLLSAL